MNNTILQAITTRYVGPTDKRGSYIAARSRAGKVKVRWDYDMNADDNHRAAATKLAEMYGWTKKFTLVGGVMPSGEVYCWVQVEK